MPEKTRKAGAEIRTRLAKIGLYRESGHEHFNGSLVIPILDETGPRQRRSTAARSRDDLRPARRCICICPARTRACGICDGIAESVAAATSAHLSREALIDALTFWCAGYRNVTAAYGVEGFTHDHLAAFKRFDIRRVLIAFDRDEAGERGAAKVAETAAGRGLRLLPGAVPEGTGRQRLLR